MHTRTACRSLLLGVLLLGGVGCRIFGLDPEKPIASPPSKPTFPTPTVTSPTDTTALPTRFRHRSEQVVFAADFDLAPYESFLSEFDELRSQVFRELQLPPGTNLIQVYLFENQARYRAYMAANYKDLPDRRAFFIAPQKLGGGQDLLVFTYWGEHIHIDLRHELTHALLHSVLKEVPLWLDEGIAEFYELPPSADGLNPQHLEAFRSTVWKPDLARLERLVEVKDMKKPEYREAWAWVHLMLRGRPESRKVLLDYLQQMRSGPPGDLMPHLARLYPDPNGALLRHLAAVPIPTPNVADASR